MKVCVLGAAGGIGQPLSLLLKLQLPAGSELSLYDVAPFTPGVAVDLSHIPTDVAVSGFVGDDVEAAMKDIKSLKSYFWYLLLVCLLYLGFINSSLGVIYSIST